MKLLPSAQADKLIRLVNLVSGSLGSICRHAMDPRRARLIGLSKDTTEHQTCRLVSPSDLYYIQTSTPEQLISRIAASSWANFWKELSERKRHELWKRDHQAAGSSL